MLNQAAQKFIFMLEKNYHGFGGGGARAPCAPPPPLDPPLAYMHSHVKIVLTKQKVGL